MEAVMLVVSEPATNSTAYTKICTLSVCAPVSVAVCDIVAVTVAPEVTL
jgi:hypothetical protein